MSEQKPRGVSFYGLGLVAGDYVHLNQTLVKGLTGIIQWIKESTGEISIRFDEKQKSTSFSVIPYTDVDRELGKKGRSSLYPPKEIKRLYQKLSKGEKVHFWYCKGKKSKWISEKSGISQDKIRKFVKKRITFYEE